MIMAFQNMKGRHKEEVLDLLSRVSEDKTRSHGWNFNCERAKLDTRRDFLTEGAKKL